MRRDLPQERVHTGGNCRERNTARGRVPCLCSDPDIFLFTSFSTHFLTAVALAQLPVVPGLPRCCPAGQRRPEAAAKGDGFHG